MRSFFVVVAFACVAIGFRDEDWRPVALGCVCLALGIYEGLKG